MSDQQTIDWLRGLAEKGGRGVVNNIDARCLGRITDDMERLRAEKLELASHIDGCVRVAAAKVQEPRVSQKKTGSSALLSASVSPPLATAENYGGMKW